MIWAKDMGHNGIPWDVHVFNWGPKNSNVMLLQVGSRKMHTVSWLGWKNCSLRVHSAFGQPRSRVFIELGTLQTNQLNPNQWFVVRNPWFGVSIWTNRPTTYSHYNPHQYPMFVISIWIFGVNTCSICEGGRTWMSFFRLFVCAKQLPFLILLNFLSTWFETRKGTLTMNPGRHYYHNHGHPTRTSKITNKIPFFWHPRARLAARRLAISWGYGKSQSPAARSMPYMAPAMMGAMAGCMGGAFKILGWYTFFWVKWINVVNAECGTEGWQQKDLKEGGWSMLISNRCLINLNKIQRFSGPHFSVPGPGKGKMNVGGHEA